MRASPSETNRTCDTADAKKAQIQTINAILIVGFFQPLSLGKAEA